MFPLVAVLLDQVYSFPRNQLWWWWVSVSCKWKGVFAIKWFLELNSHASNFCAGWDYKLLEAVWALCLRKWDFVLQRETHFIKDAITKHLIIIERYFWKHGKWYMCWNVIHCNELNKFLTAFWSCRIVSGTFLQWLPPPQWNWGNYSI